jgi:hypothetical protein
MTLKKRDFRCSYDTQIQYLHILWEQNFDPYYVEPYLVLRLLTEQSCFSAKTYYNYFWASQVLQMQDLAPHFNI